MPRFLHQRQKYTCGPVAILNALKFFGRRVTEKNLPKIVKITKCDPYAGTLPSGLEKGLRAVKKGLFKLKKAKPSYSKLLTHLDILNPAILIYPAQDNNFHAVLLFQKKGQKYIINDKDGKTVQVISDFDLFDLVQPESMLYLLTAI